MTRDYVPAPKKTYTKVTIENALGEKDQYQKRIRASTRALADKHNVPYSTLQWRIKNGHAKKVGRKIVFTPNQVYKSHKS